MELKISNHEKASWSGTLKKIIQSIELQRTVNLKEQEKHEILKELSKNKARRQ